MSFSYLSLIGLFVFTIMFYYLYLTLMNIKLKGKMFFDFGTLLALLKTKLYTLYYMRKFGHFGKGSTVMGRIRLYGDLKNISIGNDCRIHDGVMLNAYLATIKIGNKVVLSPDVKLITPSLTRNKKYEKRTHIGKDITINDETWLATNSTVIGGVVIGKGALVSTGAVVTKNVSDYEIVGGVPAIKIGNNYV